MARMKLISGGWSLEKYQAMFSKVLLRIRHAVPAASILILGTAGFVVKP